MNLSLLRNEHFGRISRLCALVLLITAVLTTPLAVSKYAAQGQGTAKARIAAWDVIFSTSPSSGVTTYLDGNRIEGDQTKTFVVTNNSEVTADITLWMAVSNNPNVPVSATTGTEIGTGTGINDLGRSGTPAAGVTHVSGRTWRFEPGASAEFEIVLQATPTPSASDTSGWYREYKVYADAVQVD